MSDNEVRKRWFIGERSDLSLVVLAAVVVFAAIAGYQSSTKSVLPPPAPVHRHAATKPLRATYLSLRPHARPWYGNTEGDWAARLGQCLHAPMKTVDNLRGFAHGLTPQADFMRTDLYFLVLVLPSGDCRRAGSRVIRDQPKVGMMNIYNVQGRSFTELYVVELAQKEGGPLLFAYRTK